MANSRSGVPLTSELKRRMEDTNGSSRFLVVSIENDQMVLKKSVERSGSWTSDFNKISTNLPSPRSPAFVVFFKDVATERHVFTGQKERKNSGKSKVMLILYNPDEAPVKEKMLYSSSWGALREVAGIGADEYQISTKADLNYSAYAKLREPDESVLSEHERERNKQDKAELVSYEEAKEAAGYNAIALAKGHTQMPKIVADSLRRANSERMGLNTPAPSVPVSRASPMTNKAVRGLDIQSPVNKLASKFEQNSKVGGSAALDQDDSPKSTSLSLTPSTSAGARQLPTTPNYIKNTAAANENKKPSSVKSWPAVQSTPRYA